MRGLDEILHGGYPKGRPTAIAGDAGTGKTILIYNYLKSCAERGEPVVVATFEERPEDFSRHAMAMGLDLPRMEKEGLLAIVDATLRPVPGAEAFDMDHIFRRIAAAVKGLDARHFIIEAFDAFTRTLEKLSQERQEFYDLRFWSLSQELTTLITAKADKNGHIIPRGYGEFISYWVDCHIILDHFLARNTAVRRLWIKKYRGASYRSGRHKFYINDRGIRLVPLSGAILQYGAKETMISTGSPELDIVLGGGLHEGSVNILTGPSGSGKTVISAMMTAAVIRDGGHALRLNLEAPAENLLRFMGKLGYDLLTPERHGASKTISILPEAINSEELLFDVMELMETFKPRLLVLESLSSLGRIGDAELALSFLVRFIGAARAKNITLLVTNTRPHLTGRGLHPDVQAYAALFDNVIDLNVECEKERIVHSLMVLKTLGAAHCNRIHEFDIDPSRGFQLQISPGERSGGG